MYVSELRVVWGKRLADNYRIRKYVPDRERHTKAYRVKPEHGNMNSISTAPQYTEHVIAYPRTLYSSVPDFFAISV